MHPFDHNETDRRYNGIFSFKLSGMLVKISLCSETINITNLMLRVFTLFKVKNEEEVYLFRLFVLILLLFTIISFINVIANISQVVFFLTNHVRSYRIYHIPNYLYTFTLEIKKCFFIISRSSRSLHFLSYKLLSLFFIL